MLLFYVRHGDPIYSPDSLTPLGQRQAEAVAHRLAQYGIDKIYASTSNRAYLTSIPTSELCKVPVTQVDFANEGHVWQELNLPNENGLNTWIFCVKKYQRLFCSEEVRSLGDEWYTHPELSDPRFRASVERVNRECDNFLRELGYEHDRKTHRYKILNDNDERVALFAHQGFGTSFMSSILDIPYPMYSMHFDMSHSCMSVIDFSGKLTGRDGDYVVPRLLTLSNDSHLYRDGLPTKYSNSIYF